MSQRKSPRKTKEVRAEFKESKVSSTWLDSIYNPMLISKEELEDIHERIKYHGFNRMVILEKLEEKFQDPKLLTEIVVLCSLRGPQKAALIKLSNGRTLIDMGIPASGKQGTEELSCNRIASSTADLAAFYLKRLNVPKRLNNLPLPGWLQFPTAGSIKMPENYRKMHLEFHKIFSPMIGGVFNEQIYHQMVANAYLDDRLKLFT